ncbi:TIGR01457 family HAD-type hydrolase [Weissella koreensis]|uniref:TIGR01457 family HAD-type hydrolase n=1 Tax=Weissella koreensis TaxID=165096 RepID=UPI0022BA11CE|nr:TIGR01457 family HAD-type hydrolase [Weissella koreensis]MCZ9311525.1 TIGR01457 family HAD-type hydrolase [Weissella koreensis]
MAYKGYFIDLDGTIYQGKKSFPSGKRFIERLKAANKQFMFVTNNATRTPEQVQATLADGHDIHVDLDQIYTSAMATADYVAQLPNVHQVLVVGENGLHQALASKGLKIVTQGLADAVVVGLNRNLKYDDLMYATLAIQQGAKFIATNIDTNLPNEKGMIPGAGSVVASVQTSTQVDPIVIGKPYTPIMEGALERAGLTVKDVVMVGDNYNTDIKAGINLKMDTLLVYSGISTKEQITAAQIKPTHEVDSLDDWFIE